MKGIQIRQSGGPEVLLYEDLPDPAPAAGEVLIEVRAVGVNFSDVLLRVGRYPVPLPVVPGLEAAGIVLDVGRDVSGFSRGDKVAFVGLPLQPCTYAEKVVAPALRVVKLPDEVECDTAAAVMLQGMTAHYLTHDAYRLKASQRAVVLAGAGGVGLLLIQMAKILGACVIACVSTEDKAAVTKAVGADFSVVYEPGSFTKSILEITNGRGANVVYDSVGRDTFEGSIACLTRRGCLVLYGQASGPVASVPMDLLAARSLYLTRPQLADYIATNQELTQRASTVFDWTSSGDLRVRIHETFPLSQAPEAHRQLENRLTTGKLLLTP